MSPSKKKHKKNKKDSQLVLRVNKDERDLFVELCDELDTSASREIRRFMKEFIAEHEEKEDVVSETLSEPIIASSND